MNYLTEITNDLFDIATRLKSVNSNYKVFYNKKSCRFEVHNMSQHPQTLAFVVPFDELDARTVEYALYTSVHNAQMLLNDMEKNNAEVEKRQQQAAVEQALTLTEVL